MSINKLEFKMSLPKYYAKICEDLPPEYSDYENYEVKFG